MQKSDQNYDWATIQKFYDLGFTCRDITKTFGPANKTINRAVKRGDLITRKSGRATRSDQKRALCSKSGCNNSVKRPASKFCSVQCHADDRHEHYIQRWKEGLESGYQTAFEDISEPVRRYILSLRGKVCWECGWSEINNHTGKVPVQIDHIDGNPLNNTESNLRVLCPNCHSLTSTWGSRGQGKPSRKKRYMRA